VERNTLLAREKQLLALQESDAEQEASGMTPEELNMELQECYERMEIIGAQSAEVRASAILTGLQFSKEMMTQSTDALSGGWRMRVALASALFIEPDLLMLDEPTNHLDLEAVLWLQDYLQSYKHTVLLVSHDRSFLNEVCTDVILFEKKKLTYYRGNYDMYLGTRKEQMVVQQRLHEAQKAKVEHMQEFVDRFRFNAKKASLVQSRIKAIERETVVDAVETEVNRFNFVFLDPGPLGRPVIQIEGASFGYSPNKLLFENVHMGIDGDTRIALVGPNGAGKSTLLNLILQKIQPSDGHILVNPQLRIGVFTQHHMDSFDLTRSAVQNMTIKWPLAPDMELRAHLGRFEIHGNDAIKPMKFMSGGQKSRVAFACLTYAKPHVILLDEPTNHLDLEAIEALTHAIQEFNGGVLIISHDQYFIKQVCNQIWVVRRGGIEQFTVNGEKGDFVDYKKECLREFRLKMAAKG
jgi:ATP-binding cassette subfamily F protein 3